MSKTNSFCPRCLSEQPHPVEQCLNCGLALDQPEVPRLHVLWSQRRWIDTEWERLVGQMQARLYTQATPAPAQQQPAFAAPSYAVPARPKQEWTPKRVQNTLLTIGAGLCALAALLFVAVAWGRVGLTGRVLIMLGFTAAAMLSSHVAAERKLRSTAEALMSVGYSLVLIDIASAYSLNLAGFHQMPWWQYWSFALVVVSALGAMHAASTSIRAPRFVALSAAQIPLSLLLAGLHADVLGWTLGLALQTVAMHFVAKRLTDKELQITAGVFKVAALMTTGIAALASTAIGDNAITELLPMAILAATLVVTGVKPYLYAAVAAIASIDAFAYMATHWNGQNVGLGIATLGLIVAATNVLLDKKEGNAVVVVGWTTAAVGSCFALHSVTYALASQTSGVMPFEVTFETVGLLALTTLTFLVPQRIASAYKTVALVPAIAALDLVPFALGLTGAPLIVCTTGLASVLIAAAAFSTKARALEVVAVAAGGTVALQAGLLTLDSDYAIAGVLAWSTGLATVIALVKRNRAGVAMMFATASALGLVAELSNIADCTGSQMTLAVVFAAAVLSVLQYGERRTVLEPASYIAMTFGAFGIVVSTADAPYFSAALFIGGLTSAALGVLRKNPAFGWVTSGFVLVLMWQRLALAGVQTPEAYTVPLAAVLLFAGYRSRLNHVRLNKLGQVDSTAAYGIGLAVGFVPSLFMLAIDDSAVRNVSLIVVGLIVALIGTDRKLRSPIVAGLGSVTITALVAVGPYFHYVPRWFAVGFAGVLLVSVGATWEARRRDLLRTKQAFSKLG